ncbi:gene transfer agent family protein [Methylosinus sp. Sm6]|uniref:gene transfer agent family protein n=1 Tax=Methylosinus sp. Sm6 TaxID=2866948 RepID=UPI001C98E5CD|nr:gene transfer agent family protein [Methylosinus sp. Sm6]MBY6242841.1 gene transfer agent family protein [Methylosinus sp. Sm6]
MRHTAIYRDLAGRRRKLELRLGEIGELERLCGAGIGAILLRLSTMQWRYDDIRETIRLGLQGGGASEPDATAIVMRSLDPAPKGAYLQLAADVLTACVMGVEPGKEHGEGAESAAPATSPHSTKSPERCE